jgi:hypothetical protein
MRDGGKVGIPDIGFIAQDLLKAQEDAGINIPDLVIVDDPDKLLAGYTKLLAPMVQAIKDLKKEIDYLKSKL